DTALEEGMERVVYTSTVGALGYPDDGGPAEEETPVSLDQMVGHYQRSKFLGEEVARQAAVRGLPVVIVNPSTPVGPRDIKPTPTGRIIVDFLNRRMPAYIDTGDNPAPPVVPRNIKPTPTGRIIVDFLNRRMPAYIDTGLNLIDVDDVARGLLLAAGRGGGGGGENPGHL